MDQSDEHSNGNQMPSLNENIAPPSDKKMDEKKQSILKIFEQEHLVDKYHTLSRKK